MTEFDPQHLIGMSHEQLLLLCQKAGAKPVHAERLGAAIFRRYHTDIETIPDLPAVLREYLSKHTTRLEIACIARQQAKDGTKKLLLQMPDGKEVETVLIPGQGRLTQCISTQAGCAIGCSFCLTASTGLIRNLSTAEMVAQVMAGQQSSDRKVRNLVLMGMGEPLHNYDQVTHFIHIATEPKGMAFSPNRLTLSTSGLIPGIRRMMDDALPCNLAVSLCATTDSIRDQLIPINRKYPIHDLLATFREYIAKRGNKRVLIEYVLLAGINDSLQDARRLCDLLKEMDCTVNLLPFNAYPGARYKRPSDANVSAFRAVLVEASMVAVVRESRGQDISAACGQLKTEMMASSERLNQGRRTA
jgi:23S rRNA (adenine2503-C2)-methyltransferase